MKKFKLLASVFILSAGVYSNASALSTTCMDFESYPLNAQYSVGTNQTYQDIFGELVHFRSPDGVWVEDGMATIQNGGQARGSGHEVNLNNINLRYIFSVTQPVSATFKYADWGGNVNLGLNGTLSNTEDLSDLNGSVINGVLVVVTRTNVPGGHYGTVALIGQTNSIERFALGGQEFWADDVCVNFP